MTTATTSFEQLDREAAELYSAQSSVSDGVNRIIAHAADNGEGDDDLALRSVADLLCYEDDKAVVAWFLARGVRF